ncbi:hypothetical protein WA588_000763, partial [Blastocystis sp. NMH]
MSLIAGETEHHRMWSLTHNGREYKNMNDSLYAIHTHVVLTFKLNRFSLHLIDGDHFVISLWNNLQRRVYRDIPLPFPQSNRNQTWNVVSIAPRSVSLSVATHFVAFYARQGASHISLVLISPYPALKAALHPYVRRGFVSFREYFWDARINTTISNTSYSMRGVVYQGEFLRSRKDYQVTTFLEMNEFLTGRNLSRFSLPSLLCALPSVSRISPIMMTSAGTSLDIAARNHRVFHRFNRECEEATDPLFIYSNTFNGFLSDKERRPATYHLITKDDPIVLLKMVEDRTCSTVNSHFTTL